MDEKWTFFEFCEDNYPVEVCKRVEMFQMISSPHLYLGSERGTGVQKENGISKKKLKND